MLLIWWNITHFSVHDFIKNKMTKPRINNKRFIHKYKTHTLFVFDWFYCVFSFVPTTSIIISDSVISYNKHISISYRHDRNLELKD